MKANQASVTTCQKLAVAFLGLLVPFASGCGQVDDCVPVEGTLRVAGASAGNILVVFTPESDGSRALPRSVAVTDADGHFQLRTEDGRRGALVGGHQVTLEDMDRYAIERTEKPPAPTERLTESRVPQQYSSVATTPLTISVPAGGDNFDLEVPAPRR
jgi:hypothetical protein